MDDRAHTRSELLDDGAARRFWGRVILPVVAAGIVALGLAGGGLYWAVDRGDTISVERQMRVADAAIGASIDALPLGQIAYAVWDAPVLQLGKPVDPEWFREHIGSQLDLLYPAAESYMLRPDDTPLYGYIDGHTLPPDSFESVRPALAAMIEEVRGRTLPHNHLRDRLLETGPPPRSTGSPGRHDYVVFAAHLARVHGHPAAVSIMRMVPTSPGIRQLRGHEPLLVTIRYLNSDFIADLAHQHLICKARFADRPDIREGEASMRLANDDGREVGYLIWRPELPGTRLLHMLGPLTLAMGLVMIGVMALLVQRLREAMRKVEASEAEAKYMALHDPLTGLPNRVLFEDRLDIACARAGRGEIAALLLLDLDRFKHVNDTLGHAAGDDVLKEFARRVRSLLRASDTIARFGGDEFGIILPQFASRETMEALCRMILSAAARPFRLPEATASVGVSIGLAILPDAGADRALAMHAADRALYRAKAAGRDCYRMFDDGVDIMLGKLPEAA